MIGLAALRRKLAEYLPPEQLREIDSAYAYSEHAHTGQTRAGGNPYIVHPLTVADILADWRFGAPAVIAALLHDVVEDTPVTLGQIQDRFGDDIARLVDGLSKIERLQSVDRQEKEAENFRKLLLAAVDDWRVLFIKLADRLHNMRTLAAIPKPQKRRAIAQETLDIYAPIAQRMGFLPVGEELQNLAFRHLHPHRYRVLSKAVNNASINSRQAIADIEQKINDDLRHSGVAGALAKRRKNLYSIHNKMEQKQLSFAQVDDIMGFRLVVEDRLQCYLALGVLHRSFPPAPFKFKDYIATPKSNGYQSLHTVLLSPAGVKIEIQIRTRAMHEFAEHGLAAHWIYKQHSSETDQSQQEIMRRLSSLVRLHAENAGGGEFMEHVRVDLSPGEMHVLAPDGKVVSLPKGATALDFAYSIHTDVGDRAERAMINGQPRPLFSALNTGDQIAVKTHPDCRPMPHWLRYAKTARARSRIRQVLGSTGRTEAQALGRRLLIRALKQLKNSVPLEEVTEEQWRAFLGGNHMSSTDEVYLSLGLGKLLPGLVARGLLRRAVRKTPDAQPLKIAGAGNAAIRLSPCCLPIPFEPIIGLLRKEHGLVIHSGQCAPMQKQINRRSEKWIDVAWHAKAGDYRYQSALQLDCRNSPGLIGAVSGVIGNSGVNIVTCNFDGGALEHKNIRLDLIVEIHTQGELDRLLKTLNHMAQVQRAVRRFADKE